MGGRGKGKKKKSKGKSNNVHKSNNKQDETSSSNIDSVLEEVLLERVELLYKKALEKMMELGFGMDVVVTAILMNGSIFGGENILSNILSNAIEAIKKGHVTDSEIGCQPIFEDIHELARFSMQTLIKMIVKDQPNMEKVDAILYLLQSNSLKAHRSSRDPSHSKDHEDLSHKNVSEIDVGKMLKEHSDFLQRLSISSTAPSSLPSSKRIVDTYVSKPQINDPHILRGESSSHDFGSNNFDFLKSFANCPSDRSFEDWIRTCSEDSKYDLILNMPDEVENLMTKGKEKREWARKTVIQMAKRLNATSIVLRDLRMVKDETDRLLMQKEEFDCYNTMIMERENKSRMGKLDLESGRQVVKRVAVQNREIQAKIVAYNLSASETEKSLLQVQKRERKNLKKSTYSKKHVDDLKRQIAEEKQKLVEIQQRMQQVNETQEQAKLRLRQEKEAKEQAHALLMEEKRLNRLEKENSKSRLASVRKELDMKYQQMMDYWNRLRLDLAQLKAAQHLSNASSSSSAAATSFQSHPHQNSRPCIICLENDVCILFLPCAHEVICFACNEEVYDTLEDHCPCCKAQIEKRVKVYGPCS